MKPFNNFLVVAFVSAAMILPNIVQAMEIRQFDKMDDRDQGAYVGLLVQGAEQVLIDEGNAALAAQVDKLFLTKLGNDKMSLGMVEFERNLALAREADAKRVLSNPNAHRLEVEDAMLVTLKKNNIPLSQDFIKAFRAINNNFQPKSLPATPPAPPPQ